MRWSETSDTNTPRSRLALDFSLRRTIHQLTNKIRFAFLPGCNGRCVVPFGNASGLNVTLGARVRPRR